MTRFKGVMYDLDGTLLDTLNDIAAAVEFALASEGLPGHPAEKYNQFIGRGLDNLVASAAGVPRAEMGQEMAQRLKNWFGEYYAEHWADATVAYPGITAMLETLAAANIPLWVHSNKPHEFCQNICTHFFPQIPFAAVAGGRAGVPLKPAPDAALALIAAKGLDSGSVLMVGDMLPDIELARRAGMVSAGALWGFFPEEVRQADYTVSTPQDVVRLVLGQVSDAAS